MPVERSATAKPAGNHYIQICHQWLVMKMPNGPEKTTRIREEAVKLATFIQRRLDS